MIRQAADASETSYQEALQTLQRLAGARPALPAPPEPDGPAPAPLPPRSAALPAWSEQSFRELLEVLPDAVVVIDQVGAIVLVNRQTERLFGYARDELLGQAIEILVPERMRQAHVGHRDRYLAAPRTRPLGAGMELYGRRKDGSEFPVEISLSPLGGPAGLLVTSVIRDVSDRKRTEAKFRTLVENIPAVTFFAPLDDASPELYVSPQVESLLGFSQKEWLEDPVLWHRQLHPEDRKRWNRGFAPTCASGEPFRDSYRFLAKGGEVVWVHGSANMVRDDSGRLQFLQGVAFDITPIKKAEESLREQARLATLRADISDAVTRADTLAGMLGHCAAALERDLDDVSARVWTFDEKAGVLTLTAGAEDAPARVPPGQGEVGQIATTREARHTDTSAGYPLVIEGRLLGVMTVTAGAPLSPAARQTLELIAAQVALGIKRKQAEDELLRANAVLDHRVHERTEELTRSMAELRAMTEEMRKYSYHATHDLKEPLRTILVQTQKVQRLAGDALNDEAKERVGKVIDGVARMQALLNRLRDYAHVNLDATPEPVHCEQAVVRACASLEAALDESQTEVDLTTEMPTVVGMKEHLELLFQNLIGNAVKYRDPARPPRVEVGAQRHADGWLFWVRDNGRGIEPRYWHKVFQIGTRLDTRASGWGYGLAICEKTVTRHGGRSWVASEPGQGTTFYFTLPEQPSSRPAGA
jgi:PAS domain S-box-containing protein